MAGKEQAVEEPVKQTRMIWPEETKRAVQEDLLAGMEIAEASTKYGVRYGTVQKWRADIKTQLAMIPSDKRKPARIDIQGDQIAALHTGLAAMIAVHNLVRDKKWLERQSAEKVGRLYKDIEAAARALAYGLGQPAPEGEPPDEAALLAILAPYGGNSRLPESGDSV